jgi:hypothetical protein
MSDGRARQRRGGAERHRRKLCEPPAALVFSLAIAAIPGRLALHDKAIHARHL